MGKRKPVLLSASLYFIITLGVLALVLYMSAKYSSADNESSGIAVIKLPPVSFESNVSVEKALLERRSVRQYKNIPLSLSEVSQLLWAGQGVTDSQRGLRTSPSAGATYPLKTYLISGNVTGLAAGIYEYDCQRHLLKEIQGGDFRPQLSAAAFGQSFLNSAPIIIVFSANYNRTTSRYGKRGIRYVDMESGHAAQNVYLQAVSLNLVTVAVGAFSDGQIKKIMRLPAEEEPVYMLPVGKP